MSLKEGKPFLDDKPIEKLADAVDEFMMSNGFDTITGMAALAMVLAAAAAGSDIEYGVDQLNAGESSEDIHPFALSIAPAFFTAAYGMFLKAAHDEGVAELLARGQDFGFDASDRVVH